jgi:hypothetical protein
MHYPANTHAGFIMNQVVRIQGESDIKLFNTKPLRSKIPSYRPVTPVYLSAKQKYVQTASAEAHGTVTVYGYTVQVVQLSVEKDHVTCNCEHT